MKICLVPADFSGPGCYRVLFPGKELRKRGHDARVPPYDEVVERGEKKIDFFSLLKMRPLTYKAMAQILARKYLELEADVYLFHQQASYFSPYLVKFLRDAGRTVICDTDDYHLGLPWYHPGNRPENRYFYDNLYLGFTLCDLITVSTPFLAEKYTRYNKTALLPNYLDWEMWEDITPRYEQENRRLRIGWYGQASLRGGDLAILAGMLGPFLRRHKNVDLVLIGDRADRVHDLLETPHGQRVYFDGTSFTDMNLPNLINRFDIGLVPLELNPFNEGKSHLKGMEMNACGIPIVTSPTASYRDWVDEGRTGFVAKRAPDWIRALEALVGDDGLRREMGRNARAKASENTIQQYVGEWETLYESQLLNPDVRMAKEAIQRGAIQKVSEFSRLVSLVRDKRPKIVVEIGSGHGGSFWAWCKLADEDALLVSIDFPGGDATSKINGEDLYGKRNLERLHSYGCADQELHLWLADSHSSQTIEKLEKLLDGRKIDFLFIDGDHSYEGVKRDFELYSPFVDGVIAFHDVIHHTKIPDAQVHRFWAEVKEQFPSQEFLDRSDLSTRGPWGGIGVLTHERVREPV